MRRTTGPWTQYPSGMAHFDLLIIGGGSGNSILTPEFDDWNVAMVERGPLGGTCLNVGCIPSKMYVLPADRVVEAHESRSIDVSVTGASADWVAARDRIFGRIDAIVDDGTNYRRNQPNVTYYAGDARFTGDHTVEIELAAGDTAEVTADRIVLAAGARPHIPDVEGLTDTPFHTSDTIMRIDDVPDHLVIIGGGFIAAEMGHVFAAMGSRVTVIHRRDHVLRYEDDEIAERFAQVFAQRVDLRLRTEPTRVEHSNGRFRIEIRTRDELGHAHHDDVLDADALLVTTGRIPNGRQLRVEATGVRLDGGGYVLTDHHLRTTADGIWALGDIRNHRQLKHLANQEARVVSHNLIHPDSPIEIDQSVVPHAVFSHPQIGSVGLREEELRALGTDYLVGRCDYGRVAYGWALADTTGFAKILIDADDLQILGAHIIGPQASTLLQQIVQAMAFRISADRLARDQIWCHPALPEVLENALLSVL